MQSKMEILRQKAREHELWSAVASLQKRVRQLEIVTGQTPEQQKFNEWPKEVDRNSYASDTQ